MPQNPQMSRNQMQQQVTQRQQSLSKTTALVTANHPQRVDDVLKAIYYDPKQVGSFGGVEPLVRSAYAQLAGAQSLKYIRQRARAWLMSQDTYTLHKPLRYHFKRNRTLVYGIDDQWQADLVDMREWSRENRGNAYLLTCIDIFSKYAWVRPIKTKSAYDVRQKFQSIFASSNRVPQKLQTDKGKEFLNRPVQALFQAYGVQHFTTENETKAAIVERFNRTLKTKMWRYFTETGNHHYMDVLKHLVDSYNTSRHRTTGLPPTMVTLKNEGAVWNKMFGNGQAKRENYKYLVGEQVRLSKLKWPFEKGYLPNWTDEVFVITRRLSKYPRCVYKVADVSGEDVSGFFYEEELQLVKKNLKEDEFEIEQILQRRVSKRDGKEEVLVKWKGWPTKFNSWTRLENNEDD